MQLLVAMTDSANDKIFNAKLGKLLHLPHPQSSSAPELSTSMVTGKKRKLWGGANAKPKLKKAARMKAVPKKKLEKDLIAEDEEDEEIENEEDVEEENLSEDLGIIMMIADMFVGSEAITDPGQIAVRSATRKMG